MIAAALALFLADRCAGPPTLLASTTGGPVAGATFTSCWATLFAAMCADGVPGLVREPRLEALAGDTISIAALRVVPADETQVGFLANPAAKGTPQMNSVGSGLSVTATAPSEPGTYRMFASFWWHGRGDVHATWLLDVRTP